jgi:hypothetical protein
MLKVTMIRRASTLIEEGGLIGTLNPPAAIIGRKCAAEVK